MWIVFKFLIKNICSNKARTFLIVLSVMISSSLICASGAISDTMVKMYIDRMKKDFGDTDIIIRANEYSSGNFFDLQHAKAVSEKTDYIVGAIQGYAAYNHNENEVLSFALQGMNMEDMLKIYSVSFSQEHNLTPFAGNKIIIGKLISEKYNLKAGQEIELKVNKVNVKFQISGIVYPGGPFIDGGQAVFAIVPKDTLGKLMGSDGKESIAYVKLKDDNEKLEIINKLSRLYDSFLVKEPFTQNDVEEYSKTLVVPFMLLTLIICVLSVFIIYSSFKVIASERLPIVGTFRSIGATKFTMNIILCSESVIYGLVGGFLGCGLGFIILYVTSMLVIPSWMRGVDVSLDIKTHQMILALALAALLSFISAIIPIIKVSNVAIKDIILNNVKKETTKKSISKLILGMALFTFSIMMPQFATKHHALIIDSLSIISLMSSIVLLVPFLTALLSKAIEKIYSLIFGNISTLAMKNIRDNKNIINNITLLAIGISSMLMINTVSFSIVTEVSNYFEKRANFDIIMQRQEMDKELLSEINSIEKVKDSYGTFRFRNIKVEGYGTGIGFIEGIDPITYFDFRDMEITGKRDVIVNELGKDRNIVLSNSLKEKFGVSIYENITLKMAKGDREYKVIGFFDTLLENGSYALIHEKYIKQDMGVQFFSDIYVKTKSDPDHVKKEIVSKIDRKDLWIVTIEELIEMNRKNNEQLFMILNVFSILTVLIGMVGIVNNFIIGFIDRRQTLAIFRSIGMSKFQTMKMILIEALTGGFIGGVIGVISGIILIFIVRYLLKAMYIPVPVSYSVRLLVCSLLAGVLIKAVASISPLLKTSKLNIIESIKHE